MFFITIVWLIIKKIKKTFRAFVKNLKNYLDLLNFFWLFVIYSRYVS